jgi:hypothetical protein
MLITNHQASIHQCHLQISHWMLYTWISTPDIPATTWLLLGNSELVGYVYVGERKHSIIKYCKSNNSNMFISKKHFRPGGMAASEWTGCVRAVRDAPVADYSSHGINTTCRVAYYPKIAVSPLLLALKISPYVPAIFSSTSEGRRWEDMIRPGRKDPRNCTDPWKFGKSE